jgi:hypothetical protein
MCTFTVIRLPAHVENLHEPMRVIASMLESVVPHPVRSAGIADVLR